MTIPTAGATTASGVFRAPRSTPNTAQTSGMSRAAAITDARVGAEKLWAGTVTIHATRQDRRPSSWRAGERHLCRARAMLGCAGASGWNMSPRRGRATSSTSRPTCRTRRSTPTPNEPLECVLVRSGQEPVVVNLDLLRPGRAAGGGLLGRPDSQAPEWVRDGEAEAIISVRSGQASTMSARSIVPPAQRRPCRAPPNDAGRAAGRQRRL